MITIYVKRIRSYMHGFLRYRNNKVIIVIISLTAVNSSQFSGQKEQLYADNVDTGGDPENRSICCCERLR